MTGETANDWRPYAAAWTYRYGVTVIVLGVGVSIGPCREGPRRDWWPVGVFRNVAVRGIRRRTRRQRAAERSAS